MKTDSVKRIFIPGDEWLYIKVYCGYKTADRLLSSDIPILIEQLYNSNIINKWFFIRYFDTDFHIRIRFNLESSENIMYILKLFNNRFKEYIDAGIIWNLQLDTYKRELERYGHNTIEEIESIFHVDSEYVVKALSLIGAEDEQQRWLFGMKMVDCLLNDFTTKIEEKIDLIKIFGQNLKDEYRIPKEGIVQLDTKFRKFRKDIESSIENETYFSLPITELINKKSLAIQPFVRKIIIHNNDNTLKVPLIDLINSIIHMMLNRYFRTKPRLYEMVIYEFLYRYYASAFAKIKYNQN